MPENKAELTKRILSLVHYDKILKKFMTLHWEYINSITVCQFQFQ